MLGHHESYAEKIVVAYGTQGHGGCIAEADLYPPLARVFTKDLTAAETDMLPDFHDPDKVIRMDDDVHRILDVRPLKPEPTKFGLTFQALLKQHELLIPEDCDVEGEPRLWQGRPSETE
eukprot:TRINITY_DN38479_c0_g1_i1.p2 TRINITY_DN38479_c0_g1~~TRINITY_DN38479_c0_g1_i1.p2  ORF type:complete len:119 (-),score=13.42 TRINITY_DN38479_c0_g1_i1:260-616(-)